MTILATSATKNQCHHQLIKMYILMVPKQYSDERVLTQNNKEINDI